jgi:STAS domain
MREKRDGKFTVQVGATIQKTLHSRDSADRLVRAVISLWRNSNGTPGKPPTTLILDFRGVQQLSESAAGVLIEFRREFSEDKNPEIVFSNMSSQINAILEAAARPSRLPAGKYKKPKKKGTRFTIKI